jgi:putative ABC transport system permease protein
MFERRKGALMKPHLSLIRAVGVIVPRRLRADWRQEWEAELRSREALLAEWDRLNWKTKLDLLRRSLGAFWDALLLQPRRLEDEMFQDLRFGLRMLLKSKGFTAIAVLSLALGIGANTAIFSLVDAVLLRPLPFPEPDRLVMIWEDDLGKSSFRGDPAPGNYSDLKTQNRVFEDVAAFSVTSLNLTGDGEPEKINAQVVTTNFFSLLRSKPALGRTFLEEEGRPEAGKVVLISHSLWQRRFGGDPNLIGKEILLNDQKFTVVGVAYAGFQLLGKDVGLWIPATFSQSDLTDRGSHYLTVIARLKAGVTLRQAQADIETIYQRIARDQPRFAEGLGAYALPLREQLAGDMRLALAVLLAAVGCVLLIACANIANLLLSRAVARHKEIAVRAALGAGRLRVVRQLLTESVLLASLGAALGLLFAFWSFTFLKQLIPKSMALSTNLGIDAPVFGYTLLVSMVAGLSFGIAPALQAARLDLNEALKQSGGRGGLGMGRPKLRGALVVIEVAVAFTLLAGAGLLIQTFVRLRNLDPGFRPENVLTVTTNLPRGKYGELLQRTAFYQQVLERIRALPGVTSAACVTAAPLTWKGGGSGVAAEGRQTPATGNTALHRQISPAYFQTMGITLRQGRPFNEHDGPESIPVAVINETMARQFWPNENNVLGKRFKFGFHDSPNPWITVIGMAGDVKEKGLDAPAPAEMYLPYQQISHFSFAPNSLVIRTVGDPLNLVAAVRQAVWAVDRDQPVSNVRTMEEILAGEVAQRRLGMSLLAAFAALALLLASLGIYGALSYAVTQRKAEIGIRMALGARPGDVLRMVLSDGMRLALLGLVIGLTASFALTRAMTNLLFDVDAADPLTFATVSLLLILVSLIACYLPARRATKVDPLVALREE